MKTVKFFGNYNKKLQNSFFTSIRKPDKKFRSLKRGETVLIKSPVTEFKARVTQMSKVRLCEIPDSIFQEDLGQIGKSAIDEIQEIYPDLKATDDVLLFYFTKVEGAA
jgi:hypothetical protein